MRNLSSILKLKPWVGFFAIILIIYAGYDPVYAVKKFIRGHTAEDFTIFKGYSVFLHGFHRDVVSVGVSTSPAEGECYGPIFYNMEHGSLELKNIRSLNPDPCSAFDTAHLYHLAKELIALKLWSVSIDPVGNIFLGLEEASQSLLYLKDPSSVELREWESLQGNWFVSRDYLR